MLFASRGACFRETCTVTAISRLNNRERLTSRGACFRETCTVTVPLRVWVEAGISVAGHVSERHAL